MTVAVPTEHASLDVHVKPTDLGLLERTAEEALI